MLQYMLAESIRLAIGGLEIASLDIVGHDMPLWSLSAPVPAEFGGRSPKMRGHVFDVSPVIEALRSGQISRVTLAGLGFNFPSYAPVEHFRSVFPAWSDAESFGADALLINVRGAEILGRGHADYGPLPVAYYRQLVEETGLTPVFLGQIGDDYASRLLRDSFPGAEFVPSRGPTADFAALRGAKNIAVSLSTFSWLAAWLSRAERIFLPVAGQFNPQQRPDIDLLPLDDRRYHFRRFPIRRWSGSTEDVEALAAPGEFPAIGLRELATRLVDARRRTAWIRRRVDARFKLDCLVLPR